MVLLETCTPAWHQQATERSGSWIISTPLHSLSC
jgi:hypothetical protein